MEEAALESLDFLEGLDAQRPTSFELIGLDEVRSHMPLKSFHGSYLKVPPQPADQAEELVAAGDFGSYEIAFPEGGWDLNDLDDFQLLSLDELKTLPKALLRHISSLCIAGDQVIGRDRFEISEDWEHKDANGNPSLLLRSFETGEETPLSPGVITDLDMLSDLTGLRDLELIAQPLETLDGIQNLTELNSLHAQFCPSLKDASAVFTLQSLCFLNLKGTQIDSIRGIQNLSELCGIDISDTRVDDLTPLADCDFSEACEEDGLSIGINNLDLDADDFAALGTVKRISNTYFCNADPAVWIPALAHTEIYSFASGGDFDSTESLELFAADHPELRRLDMYNPEVKDLRCLLEFPALEHVNVQFNMTEAIESLDGLDYSFELQVN